jgi:hypothetical protein
MRGELICHGMNWRVTKMGDLIFVIALPNCRETVGKARARIWVKDAVLNQSR